MTGSGISQLAEQDKSNTERQQGLAVSYVKMGDVLVAQGKLPEALARAP